MSPAPRGLDHLVIAVADLDAAMARYNAIGFTTTPRALHPWGTGNSLVQLERNFLELLSVEHGDRIPPAAPGEFSFGEFNRRFLARQPGMSMLVFSSSDAEADLAYWQDRGLDTYTPFHFSRSATLPDGAQVQVAFSLGFVTHPDMPWAAWFVCQQHHPENFWKPRFQQHGNGARRLHSVIMAAPDPGRYRDFLDALLPEASVSDIDDGVCLQLPDGAVLLQQPRALASRLAGVLPEQLGDDPRFVAAVVEVDDLAELERGLTGPAMTPRRIADELWLPATANEGLALGFRSVR